MLTALGIPGVGEKTAARFVFHLLGTSPADLKNLTEALAQVSRSINRCSLCNDVTDRDPCRICAGAKRDRSTICVVEQPNDVVALEKSSAYQGLYYVLRAVLSPLDGIGPDALGVEKLKERIKKESVKEVVLATNPTTEGDATAHYISEVLKGSPVKVTRIARGVPVGSSLEYLDRVTLARALEGRREF